MYRTHTCGELRLSDQAKETCLSGWIQTIRTLGNITFIDLRDHYGITQLVINPERKHLLTNQRLGREFVIQVKGTVTERKNKNENLSTGAIEIDIKKLNVINASKVPPFTIIDNTDGGDDLRMQYRYLDLRRNILQQRLKQRHQIAKIIRDYLNDLNFNEIETPFFIKSTPEGARDFVIPSRMNMHEFYALPQSPQTFKQLLMIAGYDRYFQLVRCFRDEDLRADRQPEFTQLDCEMSFVTQEDVLHTFEGLILYLLREFKGFHIDQPIVRMTYETAMYDYGCDKPDIRFEMKIQNIKVGYKTQLPCIEDTEFVVFQQAETLLGLVVPQGIAVYTRKKIDALTDWVKRPQVGMKGLSYIRFGDALTSSFDSFVTQEELSALSDFCSMQKGDLLFLLAGDETLTRKAASALRLEIAKQHDWLDDNTFCPLWITDFPLFMFDEYSQRWESSHHPFTSPSPDHMNAIFVTEDFENIKAQAYDMVINGTEIGGGSIRIHDRKLQERIFAILKMNEEEIQSKFGFILNAFEYGAPPHGGIAFGFDRICALLSGTASIRDIIAFPKNNQGRDMMLDAPSSLDESQLNELHIQLKK